jgi:RNA polymerase sigma-70 factor (ECF subfamily)
LPDRTIDELLLERAEAGDRAAFLQVYERHRNAIFRFSYRISGSVEIAEDITHDCFLSLIRKPENFKAERASLRTYLFSAARNLWLKQLRYSGRELSLDDRFEEELFTVDAGPLRIVLDNELALKVQEAVSGLRPLQKEVLVLFEYEGLPLSEIANLLGTDVGTVKSRLYRARERLRDLLRSYRTAGRELNTSAEVATLETSLK